MKNFPHQFNNLHKLFNALKVAEALIVKEIPLTDENYGVELTKAGIYTFREKTLSINQYLTKEQDKPVANRGYLTVSRDIRRFFELLGFITIDSKKKGVINELANSILRAQTLKEQYNLWRNSLLQLKLTDLDNQVSHPYKILIRLVKELPGIETVKLMLALEAENDSEDEFQRILHLARQKNIKEIIEYTGTTKSMAANAVKILPSIAQQLGDIERREKYSFPTDYTFKEYPELDFNTTIDNDEEYINFFGDEFTNQIEFGLDDEEEEGFGTKEHEPFDPEKISIDKKGLTMEAILRRLEQDTIKLNPLFQRNEVWSDVQRSQLIESLMLKIPIPMFYVSADEKGIFSVVDGLQRLSTIRSFVLGDRYLKSKDSLHKGDGFKLRSLEFWYEKYDGLRFVDLPINIQNRILETEFTFTIINPGTPEEVKRNVFSRINKGGAPLNSQELRHALYVGKSTELLKELSKNIDFLDATSYSISYTRMQDRELILRFISYVVRNYLDYNKNNDMDSFLSDTMRIINIMPDLTGKDAVKLFQLESDRNKVLVTDIAKIKSLFTLAMQRSKLLFGEHAFRKSYGQKKRTQINKALFEVWSVLLSQLSTRQFYFLLDKKDAFLSQYHLLLESIEFSHLISRDSLKYPSVKYRFEVLNKLLHTYAN